MSQTKIRLILAELSDNKAPCLTDDYLSQEKIQRIGVPQLYETRVQCLHELSYFESNPELSLITKVIGFSIDEHDFLKEAGVYDSI